MKKYLLVLLFGCSVFSADKYVGIVYNTNGAIAFPQQLAFSNLTVNPLPYNATTWNGSTNVTVRDDVRDEFESIRTLVGTKQDIFSVEDIAYNESTWNANTNVTTKNTIRDEVEILITSIGTKQAAFTTGVGVTNISNVLSANLTEGSNITFTTNANGNVTIASSGGAGIAGTVINTGTPIVNSLPNYSDTTGTNIAPTSITVSANTNLNAGSFTSTNLTTDEILYNTNGKIVSLAGVSSTEAGYLNGVTSAIQTQLNTAKTGAIGITIDGGGSAITTGVKGYVYIPYACTINSATILLDQSGSIVIDVWKDTYAQYPPVDADSITASAPPTVSASGVKSQDTTLTGWTTSVSAGDVIGFNVDSAATATRATLILKVTK
jgi:hypothetical protein